VHLLFEDGVRRVPSCLCQQLEDEDSKARDVPLLKDRLDLALYPPKEVALLISLEHGRGRMMLLMMLMVLLMAMLLMVMLVVMLMAFSLSV